MMCSPSFSGVLCVQQLFEVAIDALWMGLKIGYPKIQWSIISIIHFPIETGRFVVHPILRQSCDQIVGHISYYTLLFVG